MNRHEALEWAADFLERSKVWEGSSLTPASKIEMLSNFADSVVMLPAPVVTEKYRYPDSDCVAYLKLLSKKIANNRTIVERQEMQTEIARHLDALASDSATHPAHTKWTSKTTAVEYPDD